jgi:hypothetical protein
MTSLWLTTYSKIVVNFRAVHIRMTGCWQITCWTLRSVISANLATTKTASSSNGSSTASTAPPKQNKPPIGYLPAIDSLDTNGLHINAQDLESITWVDVPGWREAVPKIRDHYARFGARSTSELATALDPFESSPTLFKNTNRFTADRWAIN